MRQVARDDEEYQAQCDAEAEAAMQMRRAIRRSVTHTEAVRLQWSQELETLLRAESEDSVDANGVFDAWGRDSDGHSWRIKLSRYLDTGAQ